MQTLVISTICSLLELHMGVSPLCQLNWIAHWYFKHMFYDMTDFVSTGIYRDKCLIEGNQQGSGLCKSKETKWQQTTKGEIEHKQKKKKKSNTLRGISRGVSFESRVFAIGIHSSDMKGDLDKTCLSWVGLKRIVKGGLFMFYCRLPRC